MNDSEDPHDLAFPRTHIPRASMVDNLVMSLDQFSTGTSKKLNYTISNPRNHGQQQQSDGDMNAVFPRTNASRSTKTDTDKSRAVKDLPSGSHTEERGSRRSKPQEARRHAQPTSSRPVQPEHRSSTRSRSSSNSSSVDLGHLATYVGHLGPAGNRRSQSFDFGTRRPQRSIMDAIEASPSPTVARAPDSQKNAATASTIARKNSGRSAKSAPRQKRRSGTVGASTVRPGTDSPQLPPIRHLAQSSYDRKLPPTPSSETAAAPRPGFFRRVFGSSRNNTLPGNSGSVTPQPRPSQDRGTPENYRPSTPPSRPQRQQSKPVDAAHDKEAEHVVTKKPSSFFRRRKKSLSTGVPPPLPLTLGNALSTNTPIPDAPSPVSSLKALMDPYLADKPETAAARHARGSSLQSVQNADTISQEPLGPEQAVDQDVGGASLHANSRHARQASARSLSKLHIPNYGYPSGSTIRAVTDDTRDERTTTTTTQQPTQSQYEEKPVPALPTSSQRKGSTSAAEQIPPAAVNRTDTTHSGLSARRRQTNTSISSTKAPLSAAESDTSVYKSAPSTPVDLDVSATRSPHVHVSHPSISQHSTEAAAKAKKLFDNLNEEVTSGTPCAWLGEGGSDRGLVRQAYMELFDWSSRNILSSMRSLCSKLALKGETQQVDRVLDAFSRRWCECNSSHGFKSADVVHTICYSLLLLNTDLHLADIGQKMTRTQFIRNSLLTIRQVASDVEATTPQSANFLSVRSSSYAGSIPSSLRPSVDGSARSQSALATRSADRASKDEDVRDVETSTGASGPLVEAPYVGSPNGWEVQIESVLKDFYTSIQRDPLPLFGQSAGPITSPTNSSLLGLTSLRRTPSVLSKATSESRMRAGLESKSLGSRWGPKARSRPRLGTSYFGSSRTSIDDGSSAWSPLSSTWSKTSLGKTLTSMSVDSFGTEHHGDYQSSIGFANALSQAIIRDEQMDMQTDDGIKAAPLLEDESLELHGAPWAKEGILKHKCHLEGTDKRSKDRNWNDCFAVIEKGWMRLFSFSMTAKSLRNKARNQKQTGVVGGGNWQDNAEEVWKFMLRHTIASTLPPPGYSKQRPYVWALSLPNGAVHLFSVGTPDIVKEFVSTANFWSARLSKEPMTGGVSSMEYGWSDSVINRALIASESHPVMPNSPRPSTQLSLRSSVDHGAGVRPRLPGDRIHISEWNPPQQSLMASQLMEVDQLKGLQAYVNSVEEELQRHNELRGPMLLAFSSRHPNSARAMGNWEKKSSYLLREIVKFGTYTEALQSAQIAKEKVYKMRDEEEESKKDITP